MHLIKHMFLIWKVYLSPSISTDACFHGSMFIRNDFNVLMTGPYSVCRYYYSSHKVLRDTSSSFALDFTAGHFSVHVITYVNFKICYIIDVCANCMDLKCVTCRHISKPPHRHTRTQITSFHVSNALITVHMESVPSSITA